MTQLNSIDLEILEKSRELIRLYHYLKIMKKDEAPISLRLSNREWIRLEDDLNKHFRQPVQDFIENKIKIAKKELIQLCNSEESK